MDQCRCITCASSEINRKVRNCLQGKQFCTLSACGTCTLVMTKCLLYQLGTKCESFSPNKKNSGRHCQSCKNDKEGKCRVQKVG